MTRPLFNCLATQMIDTLVTLKKKW